MNKRWIQLGIVGKAHGLNGAFFISQRDELLPEDLKSLYIGPTSEKVRTLTLKSCRWQNDRPLVQCEEVKTREAAESMVHHMVWADREALAIDEDEEYFWGDLVGKTVKDSEGVYFGEIVDITNYGASDVVIIEDENGRTAEIPFVDVYFDMEFQWDDEVLKLLVPSDTFVEVWSES